MPAQSVPARLLTLHVALLDGRRAAKLTQQQLADRLGVDRRTVQRWEDSSCAASGEDLFRWADALGIVISFAPVTESGTSVAFEPEASADPAPQAAVRGPSSAERVVRVRDRSHGVPLSSHGGENATVGRGIHVKSTAVRSRGVR